MAIALLGVLTVQLCGGLNLVGPLGWSLGDLLPQLLLSWIATPGRPDLALRRGGCGEPAVARCSR